MAAGKQPMLRQFRISFKILYLSALFNIVAMRVTRKIVVYSCKGELRLSFWSDCKSVLLYLTIRLEVHGMTNFLKVVSKDVLVAGQGTHLYVRVNSGSNL